ncbi:MAG TPA: DedA family protein [Egicoccus sp.]|nr:DedA family protein [Egicoccus sp.]HSK23785.1 DedA family protein [Egicoccus sp.]
MAQGSGGGDFSGLTGWVVDVIAASGPLGVMLLLALDNVLPVVPSEVVLPFAGYLASQGDTGLVVMLLAGTFGSTASAYVYYELGRRLGHDRASAVIVKIPLTDHDDIERAGAWFDRHGSSAVLLGRCVPFVRSFVSLPAGTEGMGRVRFGLLTAAGSGIWNALWLGIGYAIGSNWQQAGSYSSWFNAAFGVALAGMLATYVWKRRDRLPWRR